MTLTEDMTVFFNTDELADAVSYTANGESAVTISALFDYVSTNLEDHDRANPIAQAEITVKQTDVTSYGRKDSFTYRDEIWHPAAEGIAAQDAYIYIIELQREV